MAKNIEIAAYSLAGLERVTGKLPADLALAARETIRDRMTYFMQTMIARSTVGPLIKRSGKLGRSWETKAQGETIKSLLISTGSFSPYSIKHEQGGKYYPENGASNFAIPVADNRKPNGNPRKSIERLLQEGGKKVQFRDPQTGQSRGGIVDKDGNLCFIFVAAINLKPVLEFFARGEKEVPETVNHTANKLVTAIQNRLDAEIK